MRLLYKRGRRNVLLAFFFLFLSVGAPTACVGTTGGEKFEFDAYIGGIDRAMDFPYKIVNEYDWEVTLTQADITIGPLYLSTGTPLGGVTSSWRWWSLVRMAHADESHLGGGRIVGEVLGQIRFSALSSSLERFPVKGVISTEAVRSAEVWFDPPASVPSETLKIATVALEIAGEAKRDGEHIKFHGKLTLNDDWLPSDPVGGKASSSITEVRRVRKIPASFTPSPGGHLEIRVDLAPLLTSVDFAAIQQNPKDPADPSVRWLVQSKGGVGAADQVMRGLYQGLRSSRGTYLIAWVQE